MAYFSHLAISTTATKVDASSKITEELKPMMILDKAMPSNHLGESRESEEIEEAHDLQITTRLRAAYIPHCDQQGITST